MPTGKKLTRKQRVEIMNIHNTGDISQTDIAILMDLGASTISRVIAQETGKIPKPATKHVHKRNISVAATFEDHAMITKFAKKHKVTMHEALHSLLHDAHSTDQVLAILVEVIKREVAIIMEAAKTEVNIIKKKWWQL
jgi:hypothetical protein